MSDPKSYLKVTLMQRETDPDFALWLNRHLQLIRQSSPAAANLEDQQILCARFRENDPTCLAAYLLDSWKHTALLLPGSYG